jgi:hypothetical protein
LKSLFPLHAPLLSAVHAGEPREGAPPGPNSRRTKADPRGSFSFELDLVI